MIRIEKHSANYPVVRFLPLSRLSVSGSIIIDGSFRLHFMAMRL